MLIYHNNKEIELFYGDKPVKEAYVGENLVYKRKQELENILNNVFFFCYPRRISVLGDIIIESENSNGSVLVLNNNPKITRLIVNQSAGNTNFKLSEPLYYYFYDYYKVYEKKTQINLGTSNYALYQSLCAIFSRVEADYINATVIGVPISSGYSGHIFTGNNNSFEAKKGL